LCDRYSSDSIAVVQASQKAGIEEKFFKVLGEYASM